MQAFGGKGAFAIGEVRIVIFFGGLGAVLAQFRHNIDRSESILYMKAVRQTWRRLIVSTLLIQIPQGSIRTPERGK